MNTEEITKKLKEEVLHIFATEYREEAIHLECMQLMNYKAEEESSRAKLYQTVYLTSILFEVTFKEALTLLQEKASEIDKELKTPANNYVDLRKGSKNV